MPKTKKRGSASRRYVPYVRGFRPASANEKTEALGLFLGPPPPEFDAGPDFFPPIPRCTSVDDWLAQYNEEGQTYGEYLQQNPWLFKRKLSCLKQVFNPAGTNLREKYPEGKIYVLPLGEFDSDCSPQLDALVEYARLFFCLPVEQLPAVKLEHTDSNTHWVTEDQGADNGNKGSVTSRTRLTSRLDAGTGRRQLKVQDLLAALRVRIPRDGLCVVALTMCDLYEARSDLFVAGMASGRHRVAVFSLLRYDPHLSFSTEFWHQIQRTETHSQKERRRLMLLRSCRLLVHETSHLLGVGHCVYYSCCMNGSGHLEEDFRQPMHVCPVDLRKLQILCAFSALQRYQGLLGFYRKHGMAEEASWVDRRILYIQKHSPESTTLTQLAA